MAFGMNTYANAQDVKTAVEQANVIIKSKPADMSSQLKNLYKQNKKDAKALTEVGKAFLAGKDSVNAKMFAEYAMKTDKKYAPAYELMGDIAAFANDGGGAATWYDQSIYFDPKNPDAYYKYASVYRVISPTQAIAKLEDLRTQRPDIAVDALIGRIYYNANEFDKAAEAYSKADKDKMEQRDITSYAMSYYFSGKYAKSLDIVKYGLEKNPREASYNRLAFFNCTDIGDYTNALKYADALFNKSDSANISYFDYAYYGNAYSGTNQHEKAIEMYEKALTQQIDNQDKRAGVIKQLSDAYKKKGDYTNAIAKYIEYLKTISRASANDQAGLGQLYLQYANELQGAAKTAELDKADKVYEDLTANYENAAEYATFMRARVNAFKDPDSKNGLAKPFYEKLIELISPKAEKDAADKARLIEAYRYMISYHLIVKDDKATAKTVAAKLIEIDPTNETAKQVIDLK